MKTLVILGAGTAGTMMANKLARRLADWRIVVVDRDDQHLYQPGLLLLPFGTYRPEQLVRKRTLLLPPEVEVILSPVDAVDVDGKELRFEDGERLRYDVLVIATGTRILPEETEGLTGPGWFQNAFDFYTLDGAAALARRLERFEGGRLVLNVAEMPIKCPVAPLEFLFLADHYFTERGIRDKVELVFASPLDAAFTKPRASAVLGDMLERKGIRFEGDWNTQRADTEGRVLSAWDGRELDYDLLVSVPVHGGSALMGRSGLGDESGFVPTDRHTLQSKACPSIWVLGDATDLPTSKAGSVAHFQADVLTENLARHAEGLEPLPDFDGHANCFIETGFGKAILIDFNYDTEPLPGRFPLPGVGPFTLLEESFVNHWGKLGFKWVYWNLLLKGEELPIDHRMALAGKWS